ncbi:GLPGLI family protein [Altibacter sp. HG106]|uniref:GLPGLI family protein n=1 Tax=Altibacter sp. HG106 TaxID=3023937 RepID=UPI002350BEA4|nr:GLPGLI family protein [Altibacter sp. HG106]MDC7994092.1 GLPGLI family protein [Altibacter sp. HG106]
MMRYYLICIATMFLACKLQCQNIVVTYDIKLQVPESIETQNSDVKNLLYLMSKRVEDYESKLTISGRKTKFETIAMLPIGDDTSVDLATTYTLNSNDLFYTSNDSLLRVTEILISPLVIKYKPSYPWQLINEGGKKIKGFNCLKALCTYRDIQGNERKAVAYYAPSLPYPYGPVGHMGLPGLILELNVNNIVYTAINFSETDEIKKIQVPDKEVLSLEEFKSILSQSEKNFSNSKG